MFCKHNRDLTGMLTGLTRTDVVQGGQHPEHEGGRHGDGVPRLLQHELVSSDDLGEVSQHVKDLGVTVPFPEEQNDQNQSRAFTPYVHAISDPTVPLTCTRGVRPEDTPRSEGRTTVEHPRLHFLISCHLSPGSLHCAHSFCPPEQNWYL